MIFMGEIAEFAWRDVNRKAYTKIFNGKLVRVKGSRYRLQNLRNALSELRDITKDKFEAGATFNPVTGKTSNVIMGTENNVDIMQLAPGWNYKNLFKDKIVIHNHPPKGSLIGLSINDIVSARNTSSRMIIAVDDLGEYRATIPKGKRPYFLATDEGLENLKYFSNQTTDFLIDTFEGKLLNQHWINQKLSDMGEMKYRWKWNKNSNIQEYLKQPDVKLFEQKIKKGFEHFVNMPQGNWDSLSTVVREPYVFFNLAPHIDPTKTIRNTQGHEILTNIINKDETFKQNIYEILEEDNDIFETDKKLRNLLSKHKVYSKYLTKE